MTRNQIEYSKLKETQRANLANEALTRQRDANTLMLGTRTAAETERANRAREGIQLHTLGETQRSNLERERQGRLSLDETARANQAREGIQTLQLRETIRSNAERERQSQVSLTQRDRELAEKERSAKMGETIRLSELEEQSRHNQAQEGISRYGAELNYGAQMAGVSQRRDQALQQYSASMAQIGETARANREREAQQQYNLNTQRLDLSTRVLQLRETARANMAREAETARSNQARELETSTHNRNVERLQRTEIGAKILDKVAGRVTQSISLGLIGG